MPKKPEQKKKKNVTIDGGDTGKKGKKTDDLNKTIRISIYLFIIN